MLAPADQQADRQYEEQIRQYDAHLYCEFGLHEDERWPVIYQVQLCKNILHQSSMHAVCPVARHHAPQTVPATSQYVGVAVEPLAAYNGFACLPLSYKETGRSFLMTFCWV